MKTHGLKYKVLPVLAALIAVATISWSENTPSSKASEPKQDGIKTAISGYEYTASNFRDPFVPLIKAKEEKPKIGVGAPLEEFDTADLNLIAILWNKKGYYAVIKLPDGKAYTIREGAVLGLNGGIVSKITKDAVIISEKVRDQRGKMVANDNILKLHREDE
jgi:Tfp pilus assembly protein PilP